MSRSRCGCKLDTLCPSSSLVLDSTSGTVHPIHRRPVESSALTVPGGRRTEVLEIAGEGGGRRRKPKPEFEPKASVGLCNREARHFPAGHNIWGEAYIDIGLQPALSLGLCCFFFLA